MHLDLESIKLSIGNYHDELSLNIFEPKLEENYAILIEYLYLLYVFRQELVYHTEYH